MMCDDEKEFCALREYLRERLDDRFHELEYRYVREYDEGLYSDDYDSDKLYEIISDGLRSYMETATFSMKKIQALLWVIEQEISLNRLADELFEESLEDYKSGWY